MMTTMAGHKGFGIALVVELFATLLSGGVLSPDINNQDLADTPELSSQCFACFNISAFRDLQEFQKNFNTLSESVRQLKENDLNALIQRRNEFEQAAQQDFQKRQNELLAPIIEKAKNAIDKVAAAGGYLAVFDTSTGSLAYFDEASLTDIAPAVKKELGITDAPAAAAAPAASK